MIVKLIFIVFFALQANAMQSSNFNDNVHNYSANVKQNWPTYRNIDEEVLHAKTPLPSAESVFSGLADQFLKLPDNKKAILAIEEFKSKYHNNNDAETGIPTTELLCRTWRLLEEGHIPINSLLMQFSDAQGTCMQGFTVRIYQLYWSGVDEALKKY